MPLPEPTAAAPMPDLSNPAPGGHIPPAPWQTAVGVLVLLVAVGMAWGAAQVPSDAGYGGVGPNFVPWLCTVGLALCGLGLVWEARTGGFRRTGDPGGAAQARWGPFCWVTAGLLLNALLMEHLGFVLGCALCYWMAVQGLRRAAHQPGVWHPRGVVLDALCGLAIAAPVFWLFTQLLGINLPGITGTGWL